MTKQLVFGLVFLGLLAASARNSFAQGSTAAEMDATTFKIDSTRAMVEITYGIVYRTLNFSAEKVGFVAPIDARAEAWQAGKLVASQDIHQQVHFSGTRAELDSAAATKVVGVVTLPIAYGSTVVAKLLWKYKNSDGAAAVDSSLVREVLVPELYPDRLSLSPIELASNLEKATTEGNPLEKVGYIVTPNPSSIFGETYTKLYYYAELYLPASFITAGSSAQINAVIQDGVGHTLVNTTHGLNLIAQSMPVLGSLDIDGLPGDKYKLIITASRNGAVEAQTSKTFYYESGIQLSEEKTTSANSSGTNDDQSIYLNSDISRLSESELNERFEQASYIAKPDEVKAWKTIASPEEKRKYLYSFWRKRDKPNDTPLTFYHLYLKRTEESSKRFTHQKTVGWHSDMGRIYMTYGPDFRELTKSFSTEARPIIVWEYNDKTMLINPNNGEETGGVSYTVTLPHFVFIDRQGAGKFVLVHSNVVGETYEPNWYSADAKRTY